MTTCMTMQPSATELLQALLQRHCHCQWPGRLSFCIRKQAMAPIEVVSKEVVDAVAGELL